MGFDRVADYASAAENGWTSWVHKSGSPVLVAAGQWGDLSMAAGIPKYNAYPGTQGAFTPLSGFGNDGIYSGGNVSPLGKHVRQIALNTTSATFAPARFVLCDYLGFYALTDMDSTDQQDMDNTLTLPRYANGAGVQAMLVTTTPQTSSVQVNIGYTNQDGVSGRVATVFTTASNTGMIQGAQASGGAAGSTSPFIPLQSGDTGIRQIDYVTCLGSGGGFCAVVLVRPLAPLVLREQNTVVEIDFMTERTSLPKVQDGAYLNFIFTSGVAAVSSLIRGQVSFTWG
jgi:hypothetical protein